MKNIKLENMSVNKSDDAEPAQTQSEALHATLAIVMGHELRMSLAKLSTYVDLLEAGNFGALEPHQIQAMAMMTDHMDELRSQVDRMTILLDIAQQKITMSEKVNLTDIASQVITVEATKAAARQVQLTHNFVSDLPLVWGDGHLLREAIYCLIENGLDFTPSGGHIEISTAANAEWVSLTVRDTGIGIPDKAIKQLFTSAFYQTSGGLAVAKAIVEAHDGQVKVTSQLNRGSQFTIKLPISRHKSWVILPGRWETSRRNGASMNGC